jgi:peptidoglycan/xylan/chitin deacetylase (PgdA/CDA1 family)
VSDGTRTRGRRDHNPELYQLSYAHQAIGSLALDGERVRWVRSGAVLALTFDDGPDPRGTPAVLDALSQVHTTATFFVLGEQVAQHPDLLERVLKAGHDVEVHGYQHLRHPLTSRDEVEQDLDRVLETLAEHGVKPSRWRIPWGHLAEFSDELARARALRIVGWTTDTHDWRGDDPRTMLDGLELTRGGIVLAHDGVGSGARRTNARATAELVPELARRAREQGLEPGPLGHDWPVPIPVGNPEFHPGLVQAA